MKEAPTMREVRGPELEALTPWAHLLQPVIEAAAKDPGRAAAAFREGDRFVDVTAAEFLHRVRLLAKGFIASGVQEGDRVALMSHTRLEWLLLDYAILAVGGVTVPAYETSSAEQLEWILSDSGAVTVVLETSDMATLHATILDGSLTRIPAFVIDNGGLDELIRRGEAVDEETLDRRIAELRRDQLATIVYTSGTTGRPKGCCITHGNLRTNVVQNLDALRPMLGAGEVSLVFLPLAHTLTKIIALVGMEHGIKLAFATDMDHLQEELAMVRPTMVVAVPRVFEKVFNAAQRKAHSQGRGRIFDWSVEVAIRWSRDEAASRTSATSRVVHRILNRLVYRKVKAVFGGRLRFAFSGGGPLGERLTHFFDGAGVRIFEGYGLTETSPTLTVNRADAWKPGTVGLPLAATTIRVADDGEILARGPQVFAGYWGNDAATAATFVDGWFLTGDIGALDAEGFLRITGRKKEIIVTAAGKNVAPAPLEDRLRANPLISQAVVIGDARPFIAALITVDGAAALAWAVEHGLGEPSVDELITNSDLRASVQTAVDDANRSVSRAESIRAFALLPEDGLSVDGGELTPTLKVRRAAVAVRYAAVIDRLYGNQPTLTEAPDGHATSSSPVLEPTSVPEARADSRPGVS